MKTFIDTFSSYSEVSNLYLDISFYYHQKYFRKNTAAAGIVTRQMRSKPLTTDTIAVEAGGMELKRAYQGCAKGQVQAEAECFLLASNIVVLALKNRCCVLERVTTYVALIDMDSNQARAIKLEIIFRNGGGSARFTISTTGTINDVLRELCITYKHAWLNMHACWMNVVCMLWYMHVA